MTSPTGAEVPTLVPERHPMHPEPQRVLAATRDTHDTVTLEVAPPAGDPAPFAPGQFSMLYAFGVGEVPVSISGRGAVAGAPTYTIRAVGAVTERLTAATLGDVIGVRGPYGSAWDVHPAAGGRDLVIAAGGIGFAPVRGVIQQVVAERAAYGRVVVVNGARTPADLLYLDEVDRWCGAGIDVRLTVDDPAGGWDGAVGFVTAQLDDLGIDPDRTAAILCGPEAMMGRAAAILVGRGVAPPAIRVSLERNMHCAFAQCGHCQLGPLFMCRDGPVIGWDRAEPLLAVKEL